MKEKNYNLELIRIISFILVIVIHVTNYFCRAYGEIGQGEYLFSLVLDTAARVSVPGFFMISGALLLGRQEPLDHHWKRLIRFLTALIVWSAVYYCWNTFYMKTPYNLIELFSEPTEAHLWYLYAMIPIYLVIPFFQIMCGGMNRRQEKAFLIIITAAVLFNYLLWIFGEEAYYDLPLVGDRIYSYYVFVGYFVYKYRRHIRISQAAALALCILGMGISFSVTLVVSAIQGAHFEDALTYASPLIALSAISFFLFMLRLKNAHLQPGEKAKKVIDAVCSCSFGIYLIHILFLDYFKKHVEPWEVSAWIAVPVLVIGIAGVSFGCVWLLRRFRIGRKIT